MSVSDHEKQAAEFEMARSLQMRKVVPGSSQHGHMAHQRFSSPKLKRAVDPRNSLKYTLAGARTTVLEEISFTFSPKYFCFESVGNSLDFEAAAKNFLGEGS